MWGGIASVPGAIIFDLGSRRFNTICPDEALGRAAVRSAKPGRFPLGARGAGRFVTQGGYFGPSVYSGQGGAYRKIGSTKIAVFTVVNSIGTVVNRMGQVARCNNDPAAGPCGSIVENLANTLKRKTQTKRASAWQNRYAGVTTENTTITLVVTNRKLKFRELQRLAVQVHTSMARAIQPFHTQSDGDTLYAVTTAEVEEDPAVRAVDLGVLASEVAWDAVLSSVPPLDPIDRTAIPGDPAVVAAYAGRYEFGPEASVRIRLQDGRVWCEADGKRRVYAFRPKEPQELAWTKSGDLMLKTRPDIRLRFLKDQDGRVTGLILNPGHWPIPARRVTR
jgi:L-aminopeptidase/D-esterase-like protein